MTAVKPVQLAYGKNGLKIMVPDRAVIIEPRHLDGLRDEQMAVQEALRRPIGTPPLKDMVTATDTVAIVISDMNSFRWPVPATP